MTLLLSGRQLAARTIPLLVALSPPVFQWRPLVGWEGLRFVLYMLWSVQSLPAALWVEERTEEGMDKRKEGRRG